jgi:hypothetical protein
VRRFVLLAVLGAAGACGFSKHAATGDDTPMIDAMEIDGQPIDGAPGSARMRTITIPDAKIFGSLTDFPIWLVIDDMPGLGMKATSAGNDIYFTLPNGTPLEHERIVWNKAAGHLEAWVKVSLVDGQANVIDLRFGDPGPAHAPNAPAVWTNGFVAVWHMDDLLGSSTTVADARNTVVGTALNGPASATGKLGKAIDFDGGDDDVTFVNPIAGNASTTISAWVSLAQPADGFSSVLCLGNSVAGESRFLHTKYTGLGYGFYGNDIQTTTDVNNGQFTLLHWVYDGGTQQASLYRDANQVGTTATLGGTINTNGTNGHIGNAPVAWGPGGDTPNPVNGLLDEVRIANTPRSLAWIRTEHANQVDAKMFYMLGPDVAAD